tara:strand:- start:3 stop:1247 length:1245 start_codon:yes stop_codon:yes gene_type:complete
MVRGVRGSGARGNRNNPKTYKNDTTKQKPNAVSTDKTKETVNKPKHKKKFVRNGSGNNRVMSYPLRDSPSERTGDRLQIRCLEFSPPEDSGMEIGLANMFKKSDDGTYSAITQKDRQDIADGKTIINQTDSEGNTYQMKSDDKAKLMFRNEDANTRLGSGMKQRTKFYIELPIPQEVQDSNSVTWGEDRVNALELAALTVAQNAMAADGLSAEGAVAAAQASVQALNTGIDVPGLSADTQSAVRAAISGAAVGALGSNVSAKSVIARSTGQILNNNLELLFQGVNLRSFPYSITFSPRGYKEGLLVKDIIRSLKMSMAPKAGEIQEGSNQSIFIKSPDVFQLKYLRDGEDHPFLNAFKICALTGMSVNYTNAGTYASYDDGTPVNIRMNLTFKEINPIYHEDYLQDSAGSGVGY